MMKKIIAVTFLYCATAFMSYSQDIPSTPNEENADVAMDMDSYLLPNDLNVDTLEVKKFFRSGLDKQTTIKKGDIKQGWQTVKGSYLSGKVVIEYIDNHVINKELSSKIQQIFNTEYPKYLKKFGKDIDHTFEFDITVDENKQKLIDLYFRTKRVEK